MGLSLFCYCIILVGLLLVYPKLASPQPSQYSTIDSDSDTSDSECKQIESFSDSDFMP